MKTIAISVYDALLATVAVAWCAYLQFGRTSVSLQEATIERLRAGSLIITVDGKDIAILAKSSLTGAGALALLNAKGEQVLIASEGAIALRGGESQLHKKLLPDLRGWSLVLASTSQSSTIAMRGSERYDIVLEAGQTLDDPLDIRGGRINVRNGNEAAKLDARGLQAEQPREW